MARVTVRRAAPRRMRFTYLTMEMDFPNPSIVSGKEGSWT
jgi:hypothetical protein